MKNTKQSIANIILFLALLLASQSALAFYDPSTGRWLSRDPIGERGFQVLQRVKVASHTSNSSVSGRWINRDSESNENRYLFVGNNPVTQIDALGLKIWVCTRPTLISGYILNHAYFWNDQATDPLKQSCGRNRLSGGDPASGDQADKGPGIDNCREVPDSDAKADDVMKCCRDKANTGAFFPFKNDCHKPVKDCLKDNGLSDPGAPYFDPPTADDWARSGPI